MNTTTLERAISGGAARLHSLDHLRASMMFLGIWLHVSSSYVAAKIDPAWYPKDPSTNVFFDFAFFSIHSFRMPLFFVLAGFFALMLYRRYGVKAFIEHRVRRIVVPFVLGWIILYVPTVAGIIYALHAFAPQPGKSTIEYFTSGSFVSGIGTLHLWFLYDLIYFYAAALLAASAAQRVLSASLRSTAMRAFRGIVGAPWAPFALAVPTFFTLAVMRSATLDTSAGFLIPPRMLIAYGMFFAFGWALFDAGDLLPTFRRHAWARVALAAALMPVQARAAMAVHAGTSAFGLPARTLAALSGALMVWLLIYGLIGLSVRYAAQEKPWVRYLADASYWMYLIHLPLVLWLQIPLMYWQTNALLKFGVLLAAVMAVLVVTYHFGVRYTPIGTLLNGKRSRARTPTTREVRQFATVEE